MSVEETSEFVGRYFPSAMASAERRGFAVKQPAGQPRTAEHRQRMIRARLLQAAGALTELGQWLEDDDESVRLSARDAVNRCLEIAYTGDRPEPARGVMDRILNRVDSWLRGVLERFVDPDDAEPAWAQPRRLRQTRLIGVGLVLASATLAAVSLWAGWLVVALVAVITMALFDILEGSFARVTAMRDAQVRWLSCVLSHVSDVVVMVGMAIYLARRGLAGPADLMLLAAVISAVGSFVRVSALQAGNRFWRSPVERVVRFASALAFLFAVMAGSADVGTILAAGGLIAFGVGEGVRVLRRVARLGVARGGFIFLTDEGASCWGFEEEDETQSESALFERPAPSVNAVLGSAQSAVRG
jgi:hypothetical protein